MSESGESQHPGARFPWAPALLAAAGVVLAAWLWMRYSYAWAVTPSRLRQEAGFFSSRKESWDRAYARVKGEARLLFQFGPRDDDTSSIRIGELFRDEPNGETGPWLPRVNDAVVVTIPRRDVPEPDQHGEWTGRVEAPSFAYDEPRLDTTAGRFTPESVAGLVVGAWCLFVFALHLRRWLASG